MKKLTEIIENYKKRECKTLLGKCLQLVIFHNLSRLVFFALLTIIGGLAIEFFAASSLIWMILFLTGIGYMFLYCVISLIYAWIINPLKRK